MSLFVSLETMCRESGYSTRGMRRIIEEDNDTLKAWQMGRAEKWFALRENFEKWKQKSRPGDLGRPSAQGVSE